MFETSLSTTTQQKWERGKAEGNQTDMWEGKPHEERGQHWSIVCRQVQQPPEVRKDKTWSVPYSLQRENGLAETLVFIIKFTSDFCDLPNYGRLRLYYCEPLSL